MRLTSELMYVASFALCFLGTQGKPSFSFNIHPFGMFQGFGHAREERDTSATKMYSGRRVQNDSLLMVYYYDQTLAVVELGPKKLLLGCELIEVYEPDEAIRYLDALQKISRPLHITFEEMITLMRKCQLVDSLKSPTTPNPHVRSTNSGRGLLGNNPLTLFSGIIPGTKWCGTGDIADNYYDLGAEATVDRCCRTHDLCPVKIRAYAKRYNLTNSSLYTKSHCVCDDNLFDCLKSADTPTSHVMGNFYFNIIQVPCVEDTTNGGRKFRAARSTF